MGAWTMSQQDRHPVTAAAVGGRSFHHYPAFNVRSRHAHPLLRQPMPEGLRRVGVRMQEGPIRPRVAVHRRWSGMQAAGLMRIAMVDHLHVRVRASSAAEAYGATYHRDRRPDLRQDRRSDSPRHSPAPPAPTDPWGRSSRLGRERAEQEDPYGGNRRTGEDPYGSRTPLAPPTGPQQPRRHGAEPSSAYLYPYPRQTPLQQQAQPPVQQQQPDRLNLPRGDWRRPEPDESYRTYCRRLTYKAGVDPNNHVRDADRRELYRRWAGRRSGRE